LNQPDGAHRDDDRQVGQSQLGGQRGCCNAARYGPDTRIMVLALPEIERDLHVALSSVIWVIIGYLLVITLLTTQVARLGDMYGRVRMYEAGFAVFALGSLLCALSWNEAAIIGFRVLQAVGGAFVVANGGAVIADLYPPGERGRA
jgi:MFS family permease